MIQALSKLHELRSRVQSWKSIACSQSSESIVTDLLILFCVYGKIPQPDAPCGNAILANTTERHLLASHDFGHHLHVYATIGYHAFHTVASTALSFV